MGGLARPPGAGRSGLRSLRWIVDAEPPLEGAGIGDGVVWLVRPDGAAAATALARVRATPGDLAYAARWRDPERGAARLVRRRLLRALAAALLGVHPDHAVLAEDAGGRPRLAAPTLLHAAVARRAGWAALALAPGAIGVDLEAARPAPPLPLDQLAPDEAAWVAAGGDPPARFARLWTAREAYLKAGGAGLERAGEVRAAPRGAGVRISGPFGAAEAEFRSSGEVLAAAVRLA